MRGIAGPVLGALVLASAACGGSDPVPVLPSGRAIETSRTLSSTTHLFGDVVDARLDVVVDRRLLDPTRIHVSTGFEPYERVGEARLSRRDLGDYTRLRYDHALRCVAVKCIPVRKETFLGEQEEGRAERRTFRFPPAQVRYDDPAAESPELLRSVTWPPLTAVSRLNEAQADAEFPFRLSPTALPSLSYRVAPPLLAGLLLLVGIVLVVLPAWAALRWWRARRPPPKLETPLELTPLERARALVVWSCERGDGADRRKALANLAAELGGGELAAIAETLAWSPPDPEREAALALARGTEADGDSR